ncbi:MAG: hypothetical protein ABMA64_23120 [Myxococcota bacterium]
MIVALAGCVAELTLYGGPRIDLSDVSDLSDLSDSGRTDTDDVPTADSGCGSWLELPPQVQAPAALAAYTGPALATCTADGVEYGGLAWSGPAHLGGQWYAELTLAYGMGGITAPPNEPWDLGTEGGYPDRVQGTAGLIVGEGGTIGIAADLDAGRVSFYQNGVHVDLREVAVAPGMGGYSPAVIGAEDALINVGATPFTFAPPPGYLAWATDDDGGPCDGYTPEPLAPAPVHTWPAVAPSAYGDGGELVLVSARAGAGFVAARSPTGRLPVTPGNIDVYVDRAGPTRLALFGFEPTRWTVHQRPGATLTGVSVYGFHLQEVAAPPGVPVDVHLWCRGGFGGVCVDRTGEEFPTPGQRWPFDSGSDTLGWIAAVEAATCHPMGVFAGLADGARHVTVE